MAEMKTVSIFPLNGKNYPTWKVQYRMALMKDGLWGIAKGTEQDPGVAKPRPTRFSCLDETVH